MTATTIKMPKSVQGIAPITAALQGAYAMIQAQTPGLPAATIVVKRDSQAWGHFTLDRAWGTTKSTGKGELKVTAFAGQAHEIMVSGESLSRGADAVLGTLLHEAAHAWQHAAGERGTDSNGRHNKSFADKAEELFGLTVENKGDWRGYSETSTSRACLKRWAPVLKVIREALRKSTKASHGTMVATGTATPTVVPIPGKTRTGNRAKNLSRAVCGCEADASGWRPSLRASARVLAIGITCDECGEQFNVTGE